MYPGAFYIGGGAKVRDIQTCTIGTKGAEVQTIIDPGTPAFGPNVSGNILYPVPPTALGTDNPSISGIWSYDDGFIEPTGTTATAPAANYPTGAIAGLGHFVAGENGGSFRIFDFHVQANDGGSGSISNTTALSWSKLLTGLTPGSTDFMLHFICAQPAAGTGTSCFPGLPCPGPTACTYLNNVGVGVAGGVQDPATVEAGTVYYNEAPSGGFAATIVGGDSQDFQNRVWAPYIEFGFQSTALFDIFTGISWFPVSRTFSETRQVLVPFARRGFRDTFGFQSSDPANWSVTNFWSVLGEAGQSYFIFPNNGSTEPVPSRTFFIAVDSDVPATPAQETITSTLDFTTIESRTGGRTWIPLWGMGRFGTNFGALLAATRAKLTTNAIYVATADSPPLLPGGAPLVPAGGTLINTVLQQDPTQWNLGLFGGIDAELGSCRWFVKSALEYNYYFYGTIVEDDIISSKVNLSGVAANILGGMRF